MKVHDQLRQAIRTAAVKLGATAGRLPPQFRERLLPSSLQLPASTVVAPVTTISFADAMAGAGGFDAWQGQRVARRLQMTEQAVTSAKLGQSSAAANRCIEIANRLLEHRFNILGSGEFVPVDPERTSRSGYLPIDWYLDPVRNLRFPAGIPHKSWNLFEMRPGNADIKYPWELARCQHFLALAQAYVLTHDDRYAVEVVRQGEDFIEANPVGIGINWTCTMDIALRAASWCFALNLLSGSTAIERRAWQTIYRHLYETGCFILANLENNYEVTSNHFLSNVVGIHILAAEFDGLAFATAWDGYAREVLEQEIEKQILPDGADFESSVPYHRLVTELFLGSWRIAQIQGRELSERYRRRLIEMVDFLESVLRPDGTMPLVGDADDGRLVIATGYGEWRPDDARHILAPAALSLDQSRWLKRAGPDQLWEATWWGFEPAMAEAASSRQRHASTNGNTEPTDVTERLFRDAGIAVSRSTGKGAYLLVTNAIVGTKGFGNHKHNDLLSFEYGDRGHMLIVDPGSYVYTCDFDERNAFRSTCRHNTLMIDGIEQNEFRPEWLFRMFAKATPRHVSFEATGDGIRYTGSHNGYETQLAEAVTHTRTFAHFISDARLEVRDRLSGTGNHRADWYLHFAPDVECEQTSATQVTLFAGGHDWILEWRGSDVVAAIVHSAVSPSYGVYRPAKALHLCGEIDLRDDREFAFTVRRKNG